MITTSPNVKLDICVEFAIDSSKRVHQIY